MGEIGSRRRRTSRAWIGTSIIAVAAGIVLLVIWSASSKLEAIELGPKSGDASDAARRAEPAAEVAGRAARDAGPVPEVVADPTQEIPRDFEHAPVSIRGRVVDASTGAPIEDAEVTADRRFERSTRTGADGRYELANALPGRSELRMEARARGYGRRERVVDLIRGTDVTSDFELMPARRARGRVVDRDGAAVAGAEVVALAAIQGTEGPMIDEVTARSLDDGDGGFLLADLRPDLQHVLRVAKRGFATTVLYFPPDEKALSEIELPTIVLAPELTLDVTVVDESGTRLPGVQLRLQAEDLRRPDVYSGTLRSESSVTDAEGRAHFDQLGAGNWVLFASAPGLARSVRDALGVVLDEQHPSAITLTIRNGLSIRGRVLDAQGRPLAGEPITVDFIGRGHCYGETTSDVQGAFHVRGLEPGDYEVEVGHASWFDRPEEALARVRTVPAGSEGLEFRLSRPRTERIRGIVRDKEGNPLGFVRVHVLIEEPDRSTEIVSRSGGHFAIEVPQGSNVQLFCWSHLDSIPRTNDGRAVGGVRAEPTKVAELITYQ